MTPAGMALGLKALGRRTRLINIAPIVWSEPRESTSRVLRRLRRRAWIWT